MYEEIMLNMILNDDKIVFKFVTFNYTSKAEKEL